MSSGTVVSIFGVRPTRIGSNEMFARELSRQLGERNWGSIQCFLEAPSDPVRAFLALPNVSFDVLSGAAAPGLGTTRDALSLMRRHKPDIAHLHYTPFLGPLAWTAKVCGAKRVFITDHTSRPEGHVVQAAPAWKQAATRVINAPVNRVIAVSEYGRRCLSGLKVLPEDRVTMIYNSVDLRRISDDQSGGAAFCARHGISPDRVVVLQVSWIIPEKGIVDFLKAAQLASAKFDKLHLVLVGEGKYRTEYTRFADTLGLKDRITWTGLVQDPMAEGVFAAADIVCQFSRWEEVFGWTIAEAMAQRKPLIGTRVGGIPELVQDGVTGFLVDRGDAAAMADRIVQLATTPELRRQMGEAGRRAVEEKFELVTNVSKLLDVYGLGEA